MNESTPSLAAFNALGRVEAQQLLHRVCTCGRWVEQIIDRRPFSTRESLFESADELVSDLSVGEIESALAGHPRLGDTTEIEQSAREQERIGDGAAHLLEALRIGNRAYESRFGHVFLLFAEGRTAGQVLDALYDRLANDVADEWAVVRSELGKINRRRLEDVVR